MGYGDLADLSDAEVQRAKMLDFSRCFSGIRGLFVNVYHRQYYVFGAIFMFL